MKLRLMESERSEIRRPIEKSIAGNAGDKKNCHRIIIGHMLALRVDCPDGFRGIKFIEIQISSQWKVLIFPFAYINSFIVKLRIAYTL